MFVITKSEDGHIRHFVPQCKQAEVIEGEVLSTLTNCRGTSNVSERKCIELADLVSALVTGAIVTFLLLVSQVSLVVAVSSGLMLVMFILALNSMSGPRIQH
ncbi:hypothetical protein HYZ78_02440 [Candidatus Microgenomates bacterium]|nr:hypothetical protein [Candidatus Microgenomates bacterium]